MLEVFGAVRHARAFARVAYPFIEQAKASDALWVNASVGRKAEAGKQYGRVIVVYRPDKWFAYALGIDSALGG